MISDEQLREISHAPRHCWYSVTWDDKYGHIIYNIDGVEYKATNAAKEMDEKAFEWNYPDSIYLGVGTFVRTTEKSREFAKGFERDLSCSQLEDCERCVRIMSEIREDVRIARSAAGME